MATSPPEPDPPLPGVPADPPAPPDPVAPVDEPQPSALAISNEAHQRPVLRTKVDEIDIGHLPGKRDRASLAFQAVGVNAREKRPAAPYPPAARYSPCGASTSRGLAPLVGPTMPSRSICSTMRAERL